jgi:hypothetical protein
MMSASDRKQSETQLKSGRAQSKNRIFLSKPTQQYKKNQVRICKKLFDDNSETSTSDSDSLPFSPVALVSIQKSVPTTGKKIVDISSDDDSIFSHANTSIATPRSPSSVAPIKCRQSSSQKQAKRIPSKEEKNASLNVSHRQNSSFRDSQSKDTGCVISRWRTKYHSEFDSDSSIDENSSRGTVAPLYPRAMSEGSKSLKTALSVKSRDQDLKLAKSKSIEVVSDTAYVPPPEMNHPQKDGLPAVRCFSIFSFDQTH